MRARLLALALFVMSLSLASRASAEATPEERAAADALFREGRALVKQGKYAEACPKLAASHKLDPTAGALLALADCYDLNGQTASGWATFNDAKAMARKAGDTARAVEAERRAGLLEPKLSKLVIEVAPESRVAGLEVKRNGKPIDASLFGAGLPVDPGEHAIEASAPGRELWRMNVRIEAAPGVVTVRISSMKEAPSPPAPAASGSGMARSPAARSSGAGPRPLAWSAQLVAGLVVGGVGVAGLAVGTVVGAQTIAKVADIDQQGACSKDDPPICTQDGYTKHQEANTSANISNVAFALGGAALVAGVVLFVTAPSGEAVKSSALRVRIGPATGMKSIGLSAHGEW